MDIQKTNQQVQNTSDLLKELAQFNLLTQYPVADVLLEAWAKSIQELTPELTPAMLKEIVDGMKLGLIEYDAKLGIQNIFEGYRVVLRQLLAERYIKEQLRVEPERMEEYKAHCIETQRLRNVLAKISPKTGINDQPVN